MVDNETTELYSAVQIGEIQYQVVAAMGLAGATDSAIAKELGVSRYFVKKIQSSSEYKTFLEELRDRVVNKAVTDWKVALSETTPQVIQLFKDLIADKNPKAIDIFLKTIGVDKEQINPQTSNIQVVLPNMGAVDAIEVKTEGK